MDLLNLFINYLNSQTKGASKLTVKNYKADISQFIAWYEKEFNKTLDPIQASYHVINLYKQSRLLGSSSLQKISARSLQRHLSSLRKFFVFLKTKDLIPEDPFETMRLSQKNVNQNSDKWRLMEFKNYLYLNKIQDITIKNYIVDLKQFFNWVSLIARNDNKWKAEKINIFDSLNSRIIEEYKNRLLNPALTGGAAFSPKTVNRKLSSLRKFVSWAKTENFIKNNTLEVNNVWQNPTPIFQTSIEAKLKTKNDLLYETLYSDFPPLRLFQKTVKAGNYILDNILVIPLIQVAEQIKYIIWTAKGKPLFYKMSAKNFAKKHESSVKISSVPKSFYAPLLVRSRTNWYKRYRSYRFTHYLHLGILIFSVSFIASASYNGFLNQPKDKEVLSATDSKSRILSFKGKLSDSFNNPITLSNTQIRAALYNDPVSTDSALLWQEVLTVTPDNNGVFEAGIGKNIPIPNDIFINNPSIFLGISIEQSPELIPRQEIPSISYAYNAETLQGLKPITDLNAKSKNAILALDSSGNLTIGGEATPVFQATGGSLTLSGKLLLLATVHGTNGDVILNPDGLGTIDMQKPIQNTSNNNNIDSAIGSVEIDDSLSVLATTSAQSAFTINQDSTGNLITASASGSTIFTVENNGNIVSAEGASWRPIFDSSNALNIASASGRAFVSFDSLNTNVGIGTVIPQKTLDLFGSFRATGEITFSNLNLNGGILYASQSGMLTQVTPGTSTQCLLGGTTPKFGDCPFYENIKESGGNIGIGIATPNNQLHVTRPLSSGANGKALVIFDQIENQDIFTASSSGATRFKITNSGNLAINTTETSNPITVGTDGTNGNGAFLSAGGQWTNVSSKDTKTNFNYLDAKEILDKINKLQISKWSYKLENPNIQHIGPIAEDFYSLFEVGNDNKHISSIDPSGVALLGIQGLYSKQESLEKILKNINPASIDDIDLAKNNTASIYNSIGPYELKNPFNENIKQIGVFSQMIIANLKAGLIKADEITTNSLSIATESVTIAGISLADYISSTVNNILNTKYMIHDTKIVSPIAKANEIQTNIISPLADDSNISISLEDSKLTIYNSKDASGSAIAVIDSKGNASFSGTLTSNNLNIENDATISGTLTARKILADSIEGLDARVSSLSASQASQTSSYSARLSLGNLNADFASFSQGLMSFGPTSLAETSIAGPLYIEGTLTLSSNSINVLGHDLELQPLRQGGISFLSGLLTIDNNGNLKTLGNADFAKDVSIKGKLAMNIISPLPDSDLVVNNASNSAVLSVNQVGDLIASGSGTFSKLNLSLVQPALAVSQTEVIATGSAGVTSINPYQTEITIKNHIVTDKSLIYITPVGTPSAQSPFLIRQTNQESFTVGIQTPILKETSFNWLIVN